MFDKAARDEAIVRLGHWPMAKRVLENGSSSP
jgi:hypothetical protein